MQAKSTLFLYRKILSSFNLQLIPFAFHIKILPIVCNIELVNFVGNKIIIDLKSINV